MVNIISYNKLPEKNEFIRLYVDEGMLQKDLAKKYKCSKKRISQWIKYFGLNTRPRGTGNNTKYNFTEDYLQILIDDKYTRQEMSELLGMSKSNLNRLLRQYGIKKQFNTSEYQKYSRKVRNLTEQKYAKYIHYINPNNLPRTLCGVEGGYQLDHIKGIRECFDEGVSVEECSHYGNLQMIPWEENLQKRKLKGIVNGKR